MKKSSDYLVDYKNQNQAVKLFRRHFHIPESGTGLELLRNILEHFSKFPYENISKILKYNQFYESVKKIRLPDEVIKDHIKHHLGGTCFSLTYFLETVLTLNGFQCYPILADMRSGRNVHCAIVVILDHDKFLVDPGYLLNQPIQVSKQDTVLMRTGGSGIQLTYQRNKDVYSLFTFTESGRKWRYSFVDDPVPNDTFLRYWLASFSWNTMHGLCLTKIEHNKMIYIHKYFMRETTATIKRNFNIRSNYSKTINTIFDISNDLVKDALTALEGNLERERELGIWVPKKETGGISS